MTLTGSPTPNPTTPWRHRAPALTFLAVFMALAVAAPALAADMQVVSVPTMLGPKSFLEISNTIELGDWSKFAKIMRRSPEISGVLLSSNGGSADDGLAIAKQVFEQKLDAMVTDTCHSICTVIFLAGNERYLNSGANLTVVAENLPEVWWRIPVLVLSAFQNGLLEEVLVAGYLLHRLRQLGWSDNRALAASAVLRGSYHLYQGFGGFLGNLAMGLVFGRLYQRWGRVTPLVIAHTLIDIVAFVGYALLVGKVSWLPV